MEKVGGKRKNKNASYSCSIDESFDTLGDNLNFLVRCWSILILKIWTFLYVHQREGMHWIALVSAIINELPLCLGEHPRQQDQH